MKKTKPLKYNPKTHTYKVGNKKLISVTTWIKQFFNEFDEKKVAKNLKYIYKSKGIKKGVREILNEWKVKRQDGSFIHSEIDRIIKSKDFVVLDKDLNPYVVGALMFLQEFTTDKTLMSEFILHDEDLGLAGTIDLIIFDDNTFSLIDWKTSNSIKFKGYKKSNHPIMKDEEDCNFTHYTLQLSTYAYLLESLGFKCSSLRLVQLEPNNYKLFMVEYRKDKVEEMLRYDGRLK